jgi:hypothetical protein
VASHLGEEGAELPERLGLRPRLVTYCTVLSALSAIVGGMYSLQTTMPLLILLSDRLAAAGNHCLATERLSSDASNAPYRFDKDSRQIKVSSVWRSRTTGTREMVDGMAFDALYCTSSLSFKRNCEIEGRYCTAPMMKRYSDGGFSTAAIRDEGAKRGNHGNYDALAPSSIAALQASPPVKQPWHIVQYGVEECRKWFR